MTWSKEPPDEQTRERNATLDAWERLREQAHDDHIRAIVREELAKKEQERQTHEQAYREAKALLLPPSMRPGSSDAADPVTEALKVLDGEVTCG